MYVKTHVHNYMQHTKGVPDSEGSGVFSVMCLGTGDTELSSKSEGKECDGEDVSVIAAVRVVGRDLEGAWVLGVDVTVGGRDREGAWVLGVDVTVGEA